jgi:hypothetical protein
MRSLPIPEDETIDVFKVCISKVKNVDLKGRLQDCINVIDDTSTTYKYAAMNSELNIVESGLTDRIDVTKDELIKVYKTRMVPKASPGRIFYDKLITAPPHGRCPLCGHRTATTLDHHLPKAHYPLLSVTPNNLVPACIDCNKAKDDIMPFNRESVTIHPYFDNIEHDLWLKAKVIEGKPVVVSFFVEKPEVWDSILFKRVKKHFSILDLNSLYTSQCAEELVNIHYSLNLQYNTGGSEAVKNHLKIEALSRSKAHLNSWQSALYNALSESIWYCSGGFNEL